MPLASVPRHQEAGDGRGHRVPRTVVVDPSAQTTRAAPDGPDPPASRRRRRPGRTPRSRRCRPRSARPRTTVTEATPVGGRPVRASTRWCPPPGGPGGRDGPVADGDGGDQPAAGRGGPRCRSASRARRVDVTRQTRSPPADRQKSVSSSAVSRESARSTAQPFTTPDGSSRRSQVRPAAAGGWRTRRRTARSACCPRASTSAPRAGSRPGRAPRVEPVDHRVLAVGAEDAVDRSQLGDDVGPGAVPPRGAACRPRSARLIGIPISWTTRRGAAAGRCSGGHSPAWSSADCSDST